MSLANVFKHFKTITHHRHLVIHHCAKAGIFFQGLGHDLSKYSHTEFHQGVKYYQGFCSPNEKEREVKGYSEAWMHHKGRNKHHFEYWTDYNPKIEEYRPVRMPVKYVKEMVCDRIAASKTYLKKKYYDGANYDYFMGKKHRDKMHEDTEAFLTYILLYLKENGEKAMFKRLKEIKKYEDVLK